MDGDNEHATIGPFIIRVKGEPITQPEENAESWTQAKVGSNQAVFTWVGGSRLESDGWVLGRHITEDKSLLPKPVYWVKKEDTASGYLVQPTSVYLDGDSYKLRVGGM
jgi:hypothetical protein